MAGVSGASRLVSGTMTPHTEFERQVAEFLDKPSALLFGSGYAINVGVLTALAGRGDHIFADRLSHASLLDGARWSGATLKRYAHNDPDSLKGLLEKAPGKGKKIIVTDGLFSMDGDIAPLAELANLAEKYGAVFMVDDAHGFGVFGERGQGTIHAAGVAGRVDIHIATLGKALGGFGGFVAGSKSLIDGLINFSRSFIYSTAPPAAVAMAGIASLDIVVSDEGKQRREAVMNNADSAVRGLREMGYNTGESVSPIIPLFIDWEFDPADATPQLLETGVYIPIIRPPTVPKGKERFRISVMADHTEDDIKKLLNVFSGLKK